ncbi:hypothetical protein N8878_03850 [Psychromonas sp.]|nr:hypothetical protein [Psychromonas sp.]
MDKMNTIKYGRVLLITRALVSISPLFFFILFLEMNRYSNAREKITNIFFQYQEGIIAAAILCLFWIIYKWHLFYKKLNYLNKNGEDLAQNEIVKLAGDLKVNLKAFIKTANVNFFIATLAYLSGLNMYQAILFSIPGLLTFAYSFNYSPMLLIKKS